MGTSHYKHYDGSRVDDLTKCVIPSGHAYYDIIQGIYKKGA